MPGIVKRERKRPSAALSEDEEPSSASTLVSTGSKRARHARDASEESSAEQVPTNLVHTQNSHDDDGEAEDQYTEEAHQPGSIVRVTLKNFVTYTAAEFHPGPSLNMVIGPNGTGKSTLVCAICLGLGWDPKNLGRAKDIGEFVKHGTAEAMIEIELARMRNQRVNPVIRRDIMKATSKSRFSINERNATQKQVTQLAKTFSIQIDNLCQFLPQDRVVEFAQLSPVALLRETQRAAAPEQMVEWHDQLKELRTEQKRLESEKTNEETHVKQLQSKQSATREDVERWNQRQRLVLKSDVLNKCRPIIESRVLKTQIHQLQADESAAKAELNQLNAEVAPARQALTDMETYRDQIHVVKEQRKAHVKKAQEYADRLVGQIKTQQDAITENEDQITAEKGEEKKRKQEITRLQNRIAKYARDMLEAPVEADETGFKTRAAEIRSRSFQMDNSEQEIKDKMRGLAQRAKVIQKDKNDTAAKRKDLDTRSGQQASLLQSVSSDTATAWAWFQQNRDSLPLQGEVFGPPILTCTIKDPRFADAVEGQLKGVGDVTAITCTNSLDARLLSDKFLGNAAVGGLGLHQITIRYVSRPLAHYKPPVSDEQLREYGFHSWILNHIEGPEPVLAMLCDNAQLHRAAYTPDQLSNDQHRVIEASDVITQWIAGRDRFRISRRKEYGAASIGVHALKKATYFTKDQPFDAEKKRQLDDTIKRLQREAEELKEEHDALKKAQEELKNEKDRLDSEHKELNANFQQIRKAKAMWDALPNKKSEAEEELNTILENRRDAGNRILQIQAASEETVLKVASLAVEYAKAISRLRQVHESLVEAGIRLVEANSEIEFLTAENAEILEKISAKAEQVNATRSERKALTKRYNDIARSAQRDIDELDEEASEILNEYQNLTTLEELSNEIEAIKNRLELLADGNPDAVRAYENREREIERTQEKIRQAEERLEDVAEQIKTIRDQWEPQLDELVAKISDGFSHNFAQIGCAGQVGVYKDEDFENWSIQIQVRFREGENLSILDSHRQSGGERAVSTIFYLMALQDMARSPFRVVDEINQGMDPRNERMVHERMVDIACRERTSQYFLITPKLLNDLKFHPKMKIHCIASGEYMPSDYKVLDFQKLAEVAIRRKMGA